LLQQYVLHLVVTVKYARRHHRHANALDRAAAHVLTVRRPMR